MYDYLLGNNRLASALGVPPEFQEGFVAGVAVILALLLVAWLVRLLVRGRDSCNEICIPTEDGDLRVTLNALREFVTRIVLEFREAQFQGVVLRERRRTLFFDVAIGVIPGASLMPLREAIKTRLQKEGEDKIGLSIPPKVNIIVRTWEADQKKIDRQTRKAGLDRADARGADAFTDGAREDGEGGERL